MSQQMVVLCVYFPEGAKPEVIQSGINNAVAAVRKSGGDVFSGGECEAVDFASIVVKANKVKDLVKQKPRKAEQSKFNF